MSATTEDATLPSSIARSWKWNANAAKTMPMLMFAQLSQMAVETHVGLSAQTAAAVSANQPDLREMEPILKTPMVAARNAPSPTQCHLSGVFSIGVQSLNTAFLTGRKKLNASTWKTPPHSVMWEERSN
ncbi:MAG: hypothetical protein KDN05_11750 [Verrucomicrobiae bacterium]|nr:hypothetical protein [Verrucomicrobiae bacterium]